MATVMVPAISAVETSALTVARSEVLFGVLSLSHLAITRSSRFVSAKLQDCRLLSPPVIHSVHIGAVESVPVRPVHGDTLCHGFIAVGEHLAVCVSTC